MEKSLTLHNLSMTTNMDARALNILLVDDDRILATTLSHGLRKAMGKQTSVAECFGGPEALSLLETQAFDLVISDHHMPAMSGFELLTQIRRDHHEMTLVLATAFGTEELKQEADGLGIGYITKPFELPHLVQLIHSLVPGKASLGVETTEQENANA